MVAAVCAVSVATNVIAPPGLAVNVNVPVRLLPTMSGEGWNDTSILQVPPRPSAAVVQLFAPMMTSVGLLLVSTGTPVGMSPSLDTFQVMVMLVPPTTVVPKSLG